MSNKARKTIFIVLLVILAALVGFIGFRVYQSQEASKELRAQVRAKEEKEAQAEAEPTEEPTDTPTPTATPTPTSTPTPTPEPSVMISFRGDSLDDDGADEASGYPEQFEDLLKQNNYSNITVEDNTWENRGSLSQLSLAGVDTDNLQTFIDGHTNNGLTDLTELQISDDVADFQSQKGHNDDQSAIPVLCMGFYGGWGQDVNELVEQYNLMLSTYDQQDKYVIIGVYPDAVAQGIIDPSTYDGVLQEQFGDHYLALDSTTMDQPAFSTEGHAQIASALLQKMQELGYLDNASGSTASSGTESVNSSSASDSETTEEVSSTSAQ